MRGTSDPIPAVIHWPRDATRRSELARSGIPCLLVVPAGVDVPVVGRPTEVALPPVLPDCLDGRARRLARRLASSPGELVRTGELEQGFDDPSTDPGGRRSLGALVEVER